MNCDQWSCGFLWMHLCMEKDPDLRTAQTRRSLQDPDLKRSMSLPHLYEGGLSDVPGNTAQEHLAGVGGLPAYSEREKQKINQSWGAGAGGAEIIWDLEPEPGAEKICLINRYLLQSYGQGGAGVGAENK